jgi:hypothetical protein
MNEDADQSAGNPPDQIDPNEERKLWIDYIRSLDERQRQRMQRSGWTSYVLITVLAGLLYQFAGRLPNLLHTSGMVSASIVCSTLLLDLLIYLSVAYFELYVYSAHGFEFRVAPEQTRRISEITRWSLLVLVFGLGIIHLLLGVRFHFSVRFVKWSFVALGIWWVSDSAGKMAIRVREIRKARKQKFPIPRFTTNPKTHEWEYFLTGFIALVVACFALVVLVFYITSLSFNRITPLKAASVFLVCLSICAILFYRGLFHSTSLIYGTLERDILLDRLDAAEIRRRFVRYILGQDLATWLDDLLKARKAYDDLLAQACGTAELELKKIAEINVQYPAERSARAKKCFDTLNGVLESHKSNFMTFKLQLESFAKVCERQKEHDVLRRWIDEGLKARQEETKRIVKSTRELIDQIKGLITAPQQ